MPSRSAKRDARPVTGILLLDKSAGLSSNRALQDIKRLYRAEKGGHTGSLDPLATGLLPICFGEATKIAGLLLGSRKAYAARCRLGISTDTLDADGEVVATRPVPVIDAAGVREALAALTGRQWQVPPVYSALKLGGEPLHRRVRRGEAVDEPAARAVDVFRFELLAIEGDTLRLEIECGSGTYIRSLVRDLGERLGCGAHVTGLRRLWVDPFREPAMHGLADLTGLEAAGGVEALDALLLPLEAGLAGFPAVRVDAEDAVRLGHGLPVAAPPGTPVGRLVALDEAGCARALVESGPDGRIRTLRGFHRSDAGQG